MYGTQHEAILEFDDDNNIFDNNNNHSDVREKAALRNCLEILVMIWIMKDD